MSVHEDIYVIPSRYESGNYTNYNNESSYQWYKYYINSKTGENASSFIKEKNNPYERIEACESQEKQESCAKEIKSMITHFDTKCKECIDNGEIVHVYIVVRQDKKYCGMISFVEIRKPDDTDNEKFTRNVAVVNSSGTSEKEADAIDMPTKVLPMALSVFHETLKSIATEPKLERYKGKNITGFILNMKCQQFILHEN